MVSVCNDVIQILGVLFMFGAVFGAAVSLRFLSRTFGARSELRRELRRTVPRAWEIIVLQDRAAGGIMVAVISGVVSTLCAVIGIYLLF